MKKDIFAVIMAGGSGTRFWPKSRTGLPKQFLNIIGDKTMLQSTVERVESLVPKENILIITNARHAKIACEQLPFIPPENVITEPVGRNTAPCIGLAALIVQQRNREGVMLVLPSDHWIKDNDKFCKELKIAAERAADKKTLISFGIKPTYPETGYGYIQCDNKSSLSSKFEIYKIQEFREKPGIEQAKQFLESGQFYWNSGVFVWKASTILDEIKCYLPQLNEGLMGIEKCLSDGEGKDKIDKIFESFEPESIDYGVMERTKKAEIIVSNVGWSDVGSWKALENHLPSDDQGNIASKRTILIDTENSIIQGDNKRLIAAVGIKDMVLIDTEDVLLVCPKERCQEIKTVVEQLKKDGENDYL